MSRTLTGPPEECCTALGPTVRPSVRSETKRSAANGEPCSVALPRRQVRCEPQHRFLMRSQASGWSSGPLARARFLLQIQRPLDFRTTRSTGRPAPPPPMRFKHDARCPFIGVAQT